MSKIDKRFFDELFDSKTVRLSNQHYNRLYDIIWPCEEEFKNFLMSTNSAVKTKYAKKIYMYMQTFGKVFLPKTYIDNMINYQQTALVTNDKYIPQDHVVHCVNLYILGIYLFFNFPIFHYSIIDKFKKTNDKTYKIQLFLEKWKTFSYYHDIGYYFEGNIKNDGKFTASNAHSIEEYINIFKNLTYYHVTRSTARLITCISIFQTSNIKLNNADISICNNQSWKKNNECISKDALINVIKRFDGSFILNNVYGETGFNNIKPFIGDNSYMKLYFNDQYELVQFIVRENATTKDIYCSDAFIKESSDNCIVRYAVPKIIRNHNIDFGLADCFFDDLPEELRIEFKFITNDNQLNSFFNNLHLWLLEAMKGQYFLEEKQAYYCELSKYYVDAIKNSINSAVDNILKKQRSIITPERIKTVTKKVTTHLNEEDSLSMISENIKDKAHIQYMRDNGVSYDIIQYCSRLYSAIAKKTRIIDESTKEASKHLFEELKFIMKTKNKIKLSLFAHHENNEPVYEFEKELYNRISKLSKDLGVDFDRIRLYKPKHSTCDHGLISAGLLYQAVVFTKYLSETNIPDILLSWYGLENPHYFIEDEFINEYADTIFAVLLHNIYTKESGAEYGIEYKQKIDINPFSYFCAFCDVLQKWGREKQIDFSKLDLPEVHYLDDDFDIFISENHINITSTGVNEVAIRRSLENEATFLEGIEYIIKVGN